MRNKMTLAWISAILTLTLPCAAAPSTAPLAKVGKVHLTASSSMAGQGVIIYKNAHMTADNGASLDADELKANLASKSNSFTTIVATGHVRAHVVQAADGRAYTVTGDKAIYSPKTNRIDFTGTVTITMTSKYTVGPLVQTGDSGYVQLGVGPAYPQIAMQNVTVNFTPSQ